MNRLIQFKPVYHSRVWGGRALADQLGRKLPEDGPIGESWEIVDRPEAQSIDEESGKTLRELLSEYPDSIMGPGYDPDQPFPILVKWLDCAQRLSLQVHPPEKIADQLGGEPKTECWYIADATPEAALIVGLRNGVTRKQFEQAIENESLESLLHRFSVQSGDFMLLKSGRLHAIDAGNLILEIQQNSDTTYRVYDWGRKGLDGKPRQLHIEESLQSIDFEDFEPGVTRASSQSGETTLAECPQFRVRQHRFAAGDTFGPARPRESMILSIIQGKLRHEASRQTYAGGANVLLPYAWTDELVCTEACTALITDRFV